jgi:hypothetical protein
MYRITHEVYDDPTTHQIFASDGHEEIPLGDGPTFMDAKVEALKNINALAREVARLKENGNNSGNSTDNDPKGS